MIILPSIDLKDGKCVRLYKGGTKRFMVRSPRVAGGFAQAVLKPYIQSTGRRSGPQKNTHIIRQLAEKSGLG